ncbi:MAG: GntR family transcriptional regulator [Planctomycetales bacterium]|nr:GntR family transcriptional regulator [Planctomycetales bacterium]
MITVRLDSPLPLVEQITAGVRAAIAAGELAPGDPLPTVRQLAADLGVNLNTVSRAYRELERTGLVATHRGRGTTVAAATFTPPTPKPHVRRGLAERLRGICSDARLSGLDRNDVEQLLQQQLNTFFPRS